MLTDAELDEMRSTLEASLPDECSIVTVTQVADGAGGYTATTASTSVDCRLSPAQQSGGGQEDTVGSRVTPTNRWVITVPYDTVVGQADRVEIGTRRFEIVAVDTDRTWPVGQRIQCVEVL